MAGAWPEDKRSAVFSRDRQYRYRLWRRWSDDRDFIVFIGLNPSTADEQKDDNTIRKCRKFAKAWNFGGFCMVNLFAFCATRPRDLLRAARPVGRWNDRTIMTVCRDARPKMIVAAWGVHGTYGKRSQHVSNLLFNIDIHCLRVNSDGEPGHPLYLPDDLQPFLWRKKEARVFPSHSGRRSKEILVN